MPVPTDMKPRWFHILLSLAAGPRHGLAVMREVRQSSNGAMHLWPATLYGSLDELMDLGWIQEIGAAVRPPDTSERRRYYGLTRAGRAALESETRRLADLVRLARQAVRREQT
jgi:DNA-binding PadR family transcriptional regulator